MSTTKAIRATPILFNGVTLLTPTTSWDYTQWKPLATHINSDINIHSLTFNLAGTPATDTVREVLFEIGTGNVGSEVTKIQLPYCFKNDTAIGFYLNVQVSLPETFFVPKLSNIHIRMAQGSVSALTFTGFKLMYHSDDDRQLIDVKTSAMSNNYQRFSGASNPMGVM